MGFVAIAKSTVPTPAICVVTDGVTASASIAKTS